MTRLDLAQMSQDELIHLILAQAQQVAKLIEQNAKLQAEIDALRLKLDKGKKPQTNSGNSSQPPSKDQKSSIFSIRWGLARMVKDKFASRARYYISQRRNSVAMSDTVKQISVETDAQFSGSFSQRHKSVPSKSSVVGARAKTNISFSHSSSDAQLGSIIVQR